MNKFKIGDILTVEEIQNVEYKGRVGKVVEVADDYYTLSFDKSFAIKENCLRYANGVELIAYERERQIKELGYNAEHDAQQKCFDIICSALACATAAANGQINYKVYQGKEKEMPEEKKRETKLVWNWDEKSYKPSTDLRDLVKAGALIAAAIDRLQNKN